MTFKAVGQDISRVASSLLFSQMRILSAEDEIATIHGFYRGEDAEAFCRVNVNTLT